MRLSRTWTVLMVGLVLAATPLLAAKKNIPEFALVFSPQQQVATAEVVVDPSMRERAVALRLSDGRAGGKPEAIGTRTDDDDQRYPLTATNEVVPWVRGVIEQTLGRWGIVVKDGAGLVLEAKLTTLEVLETNQAMGATFNANVQLSVELRDGRKVLWSGPGVGDASRYGKKFSNDNCNEVLSDALLEALASVISNPALHEVW